MASIKTAAQNMISKLEAEKRNIDTLVGADKLPITKLKAQLQSSAQVVDAAKKIIKAGKLDL